MKKVLLSILVITSIFVLAGCGKSKKVVTPDVDEEKIKTNTNENVIGEKEIDGLKIEKSSIIYEDGITTLTTSVTNISNEVQVIDSIRITYTDEDGTRTELIGAIGEPITQNQTVYITSTTDIDLTNAVSVEYEIIK